MYNTSTLEKVQKGHFPFLGTQNGVPSPSKFVTKKRKYFFSHNTFLKPEETMETK